MLKTDLKKNKSETTKERYSTVKDPENIKDAQQDQVKLIVNRLSKIIKNKKMQKWLKNWKNIKKLTIF